MTNKQLTDNQDKIAKKILELDENVKYIQLQVNRLKKDTHFLTDLIISEKSFTEDIKLKLRKILEWTKSITK